MLKCFLKIVRGSVLQLCGGGILVGGFMGNVLISSMTLMAKSCRGGVNACCNVGSRAEYLSHIHTVSHYNVTIRLGRMFLLSLGWGVA